MPTKSEYETVWNNMVDELRDQYTEAEIAEGFDVWHKESVRFDK